ncbi:macrophage colony-stimulating factor 1 receptor 1-like, partial [Copidosoma floridanum]|uniref:macrophage colony-stimulating factor 1 receptor 1-like n=1 Tax=Copidosoma floridanum TaxID=29053 RepID=UPI000C6FBCD8
CHGLKPQLYPNVTELEINEGEPLNITCTSNSYVNFYFPTSDERGRTTSQPLITPEVRSTHKTFIRLSTVFGDTGWYGCADESKQITSLTYKNYSDLSISWVYVYVYGLSEKITFDSKTGFVIKKANWGMDIVYTCTVENKNFSHAIKIKAETTTFYPCMNILRIDDAQSVSVDSRLSIKCSAEVRKEAVYTISWKIPHNVTSRKVSNTVRVEEKGIHNLVNLVTSELIIDNVTYDDRGNYSCKIRSSFDEEKSRDTYVCVFDTNKPYINLTSDNLYVVSEDGKSVTFLAFVDACPIPTLEWTHPQGYIIRPHSWKVIMSYYGTMSRLTLSNIDKYATGTFTLRAKHDKIVKELKFYLEVYGKPAVEFDKTYLQSYYSFNKTAKFVCLANRYPESNISWIVTETLIYNKLHNLQRIKTDVQNSNFKQKSTVELKQLVTSGTIKCKACNIYGCASASKEIQLTGNPNTNFYTGLVVWFIAILTFLSIYFYLQVQHGKFREKLLLESSLTQFTEGELDLMNPELTVDEQADLLPYDIRWEFPREKIKLDKRLGSGAFGVVHKAVAYGIFAKESKTTVAVKTIRKNADPMYITALAKELKIMIYLGQHLNITSLLGACTKNIAKRELLVIVELCKFGNLMRSCFVL